jgi:S1-C subfamily serine protease
VQDFQSGLAVVAIEESGRFPALPLRSSADLVVGEEVFLLAAVPDNGRRVHSGAVSGLDPFDAYWEYHLDRAVFTTAPNPGFGGGALIDRHGTVCGVVLLELAEIGRFTMATPVDELLQDREAFLAGQPTRRPPRGWLGVFCYPVSNHVVVGGVVPGSPAAVAGLQSGDVVLSVDDERIHDRYALYAALWKRKPGERVHLRVYRNNQVLVLSAELGDAEAFFA